MHVGAGLVGLVAGLLVGPLVDRLATNAPLHEPLLGSKPRSPRLPLVTAGTALLAAACGLDFGLTVEAAIGVLFTWVLVLITRTDLEHRLIPDSIVIPGAVVLLTARTIDDPSVEWVVAGLAAGLALFVLALVYPSGLGMGDVKLVALMGFALGSSIVAAVFIGFAAAFLPAAFMFLRRGRAALKLGIPFGPFLALGGVIALFWGDAILDWYSRAGH